MKLFSFAGIIFLLLYSAGLAGQEPPRTRQVHLDFHTSGQIPDIGATFSKKQFQEALKVGNINQINIFAKGVHSWSYYPTKVGKMHPNLDFDLMGSQIEACHTLGVKCPLYYTVGWSLNDADSHPEWCARKKDGSIAGPWREPDSPDDPLPAYAHKALCPTGTYHEMIIKQVEEICTLYPVDGFFFDIYRVEDGCWCDNCLKSMKEKGVDREDDGAVVAHYAGVLLDHMHKLQSMVLHHHPDASVYFNGTTRFVEDSQPNQIYGMFRYNTYQDMEDLPTGWGGYDKLPLRARYYQSLDYPITAMSGKFHTAWGEFGGYKHPDAIRYEAAAMIAFGATCNFGDQLHPSGLMEMQTYRNIGQAYEYVEKIEAYGAGAIPAADLGLWAKVNNAQVTGTSKMLLELHLDFQLANKDNLDRFAALVVPSVPVADKEDMEAIQDYINNGGKVLFLADGALDEQRTDFVFNVGARLEGKALYDVDYTMPEPVLGDELVQAPFLNYTPAYRTIPEPGTEVLANIYEPYFSRTYAHYSSLQNTPNRIEPAGHPALIRKGNVVLATNPLDLMYYNRAARVHRDLFSKAVERIYPQPSVKVTLPSSGRVSLLHQADQERYVVHLLYATPHYRGKLELIEDLVPLYDVEVRLRVDEAISNVMLIPDNTPLEYAREGDYVRVNIPNFRMHCGLVFSY